MSSNNSFQADSGHDSAAAPVNLSLNLSSNNPFRNRAASPSGVDIMATSPRSPFDPPPRPRPVSRNPFLDQHQPEMQPPAGTSSNSKPKSLSAEEIFNALTLDESTVDEKKAGAPASQRQPSTGPPRRREENVPPHRPSPSQEEALRARKAAASGESRPKPRGSSPPRRMVRRRRRNSDSSILDFDVMPITEEEMKMIEEKRRQRERQRREGREPGKARDGEKPRGERDGEKRDERSRSGRDGEKRDEKPRSGREGKSKSGRPNRRLDLIDQLDATSLFGGRFHHDGPFDALVPHRNRNTSRRAPMQAFPKDSLNMSMGGAGPLNANPDHATFLGQANQEAFTDYAGWRAKNDSDYGFARSRIEGVIFDPVARGSVVHGDESVGLGTSTFLEGTPAARTAIARHEAEMQQPDTTLARKKSLAQRIRHINKTQRDFQASGRLTNPEGIYGPTSPSSAAFNKGNMASEANPFSAEFSKGKDTITVTSRGSAATPNGQAEMGRRPSGAALQRRATTDATPPHEETPAKPAGLIGRMKSLKGPRRPRNAEVKESETGPQPSSGTAI